MAVTKLSEIKKYKDGVEVELPGWEDGSLFIAKLRRPSLMMLAAEYGSTLKLCFDGKDEKAACEAITRLFAQNFNEEY